MNPFDYEQNSPSTNMVDEEMMKNLFSNAMKSNWQEVIDIYTQNPKSHTAKITRSGDTALHVAISEGQILVVEDLVSIASDTAGALAAANEHGNTPLHLAAYLGNVEICRCIAARDPRLFGKRNKENETPFFLAAAHGRKDAFLCLHSFFRNGEGYAYCRRNDGETILHAAISGEFFGEPNDIAFQILHLYDKLLSARNERGLSPLHILAGKPSVFRSGSRVRGFRKLIYHCMVVDELELKSSYFTQSQDLQYKATNAKYPENYQTCMCFILFLRNILWVLMGYSSEQPDAKDLKGQQPVKKQDIEGQQPDQQQANGSYRSKAQGEELIPRNYVSCFRFLQFISKAIMVILGLGSIQIVKIKEKKEKRVWSVQIMEKLLEHAALHEYEDNGKSPHNLPPQKDKETTPYAIVDGGTVIFNPESLSKPVVHGDHDPPHPVDNPLKPKQTYEKREKKLEAEIRETPILIAAKNGITEIVSRILELFPVAIHDMNNEGKNIVLLAVENRQPHVYEFLLKRKLMKETIFRKKDKDGNSALHLAAMLGDHRPWLIPGAALQMQWEMKWYEFVKNSMPLHFFSRYNHNGQTARDIFKTTHKNLIREGGKWMINTSESCSVVAALIATVAFATSATLPGGVDQDKGTPILENELPFSIFAISSVIALCFSITGVVMFLAILTSRFQEKDFGYDLPYKLLVGLTSLFVSIASMLVSFCAGHFFVMKDKLKYVALPVYVVTCLPVTFFAIAQFPLYFDLVKATFKKVPQQSYK